MVAEVEADRTTTRTMLGQMRSGPIGGKPSGPVGEVTSPPSSGSAEPTDKSPRSIPFPVSDSGAGLN